MSVSVILPSYNEKENAPRMIEALLNVGKQHNIPIDVILVDDNSPDKTGEITAEKFKGNKQVHVVVRKKERGLATALLHGISHTKGEYVLLMDIDFNHDPAYIPQMYTLMKDFGYDAVNGSRYCWGGDTEGNRTRYYGSYIFNIFINFLLFMKSQDNTGGYFLVRRSVLKKIKLKDVFYGYGDFFIRLLYACKLLKISLVEIPVVYPKREYGTSKTFFYKYVFQYTWTGIKALFSGKRLLKK